MIEYEVILDSTRSDLWEVDRARGKVRCSEGFYSWLFGLGGEYDSKWFERAMELRLGETKFTAVVFKVGRVYLRWLL